MVRKSVLNFFLLLSIPVFSVSSDNQEEPVKQNDPIVGIWKTIDDKTGNERSLVEVTIDEEGNLKGKIIKLFRKPDEDQNPVCDKCEGDKKNVPLMGMEILWGFSEKNKKDIYSWRSGNILDPKTGVQYNCNLTLDESGNKIQVRGYIGFSLIGRTQTWIRVTE